MRTAYVVKSYSPRRQIGDAMNMDNITKREPLDTDKIVRAGIELADDEGVTL